MQINMSIKTSSGPDGSSKPDSGSATTATAAAVANSGEIHTQQNRFYSASNENPTQREFSQIEISNENAYQTEQDSRIVKHHNHPFVETVHNHNHEHLPAEPQHNHLQLHHNHSSVIPTEQVQAPLRKHKTSKLAKLKKRLSTHFERFALNHSAATSATAANTSSDLNGCDDGAVEMLKFTSLNCENLSSDIVTHSTSVIVGGDGELTNSRAPESEDVTAAHLSQHPPKPPPRSTSIYHLQRLQQQTLQRNNSNNINNNNNNNNNGSSGSSRTNTNNNSINDGATIAAEVVVMRDKSQLSTSHRPKSDMFDVSQYLKNHIITGASAGAVVAATTQQSNRPQSMYVGGPQLDASAGRPVKHSISRFSAYEISNANGFGRMDSYLKLDQLGEGSYATVFKGYSNVLNRVVALKEIRLQAEEGAPFTAIREASLLRALKHANIITLHDIVHTKSALILVFEFMDTDFSQYLERHPGGLNPKNVRLFMFQLLRGLAYCHDRRILHRDLKPQNLLINEHGELKLADFGLARAKSIPSHTYTNEVASLWYRPPDIMLGSRNYSTSLDMWSVGCIFVEMCCGAPAFPGVKDTADQLDKIFRVFGAPSDLYLEKYQSICSFNFKSLQYPVQTLGAAFPKLSSVPIAETIAAGFLQLEPRSRISARDALRHDFFAELPARLVDLPDYIPVTNVAGCSLANESNNFPLSVMKIAAKMKKRPT